MLLAMLVQRSLLLLILLLMLVWPPFEHWLMSPTGSWYRPYIFWFSLVILAGIAGTRSKRDAT